MNYGGIVFLVRVSAAVLPLIYVAISRPRDKSSQSATRLMRSSRELWGWEWLELWELILCGHAHTVGTQPIVKTSQLLSGEFSNYGANNSSLVCGTCPIQ